MDSPSLTRVMYKVNCKQNFSQIRNLHIARVKYNYHRFNQVRQQDRIENCGNHFLWAEGVTTDVITKVSKVTKINGSGR
jgi:hypothetical protein